MGAQGTDGVIRSELAVIGQLVHRGHALALGSEGYLGHAGHHLLELLFPQPQASCSDDQSSLGWVSQGMIAPTAILVGLQGGIVAQGSPGQ